MTVDGREGLQRPMADVVAGRAEFRAVLVYDISLWGRFQNADEGGYHEHVGRRAGIQVHHCAEQFDNDGRTGSALLKAVKRVMADEYSRELPVEVFAGQCRLIEKGFRQGGMPGCGLGRRLLDEAGQPKENLGPGQRTSLQTPNESSRTEAARGGRERAPHVRAVPVGSARLGERLADDGYAKLADIEPLAEVGVTALVPVPEPRDPARDRFARAPTSRLRWPTGAPA